MDEKIILGMKTIMSLAANTIVMKIGMVNKVMEKTQTWYIDLELE